MDKVEKMTARIDDDHSRPLARRIGDDLAGESGIGPSRFFRRHSVNAGIGRPACAGGKSEQHCACHTPYDPHLPAGQSSEANLHKDILNQKGSREHPSGDKGQDRI
jgi:hypothetical protein